MARLTAPQPGTSFIGGLIRRQIVHLLSQTLRTSYLIPQSCHSRRPISPLPIPVRIVPPVEPKKSSEKFEFHLFKPGNPVQPRSEISYFASGGYSASAHKSRKEKARKAAEKAAVEAKRVGD